MDFLFNNIRVVLVVLLLIGALVGLFLFFRIKKTKKKEATKKFTMPVLEKSPKKISINRVFRVGSSKFSLEYFIDDEKRKLDANFSNDEDVKKFDDVFTKDSRFMELKNKNKDFFHGKGIMNDVRRYIYSNLVNIKEEMSFKLLLTGVDIYIKRQIILMKNLSKLSQGVQHTLPSISEHPEFHPPEGTNPHTN